MAETAVKKADKSAEKKSEKKPTFPASLRYARISPRKMRYVVDLIRGKDYNNAVAILRHCDKRGAPYCKKLIDSAYANAMDIARAKNFDIDGNALHLVEARVDEGPTIKRWRPSSSRRPTQIFKRTCHVKFILEEREAPVSKKEKSKQKKQDRKRAAADARKSGATKARKDDKTAEPKGKAADSAKGKPGDKAQGKEEKE